MAEHHPHTGLPAADLIAPGRELSSLVVDNERFARFLDSIQNHLVERVLTVPQAQRIIAAYGIPPEESPP